MAVRRDEVQISIAFLTDESKAYAKLIQDNKEFIEDIKRARKEGGDLSAAVKKIADSGKEVGKVDLSKLAPAQLVTRAKQLQQVLQLIPQSAPEYKQLEAEYKAINDQLATMRQRTRGVSEEMDKARQSAGIFQQALSVAAGAGLWDLLKQGVTSLISFGRESLTILDVQLKADAQLKAALKSTGEAAGRTFDDLKTQASELQKVTLFGDEATNQAQAILLTFQEIKGEVFDETIPLVQDLATAFGQDLSSSAIQVGKALNDPINGVTALRRVGISFSESQLELIKTLQQTGDVAGAQRVILKELEVQVGGSARAAAEAGLGPYQQLQGRLDDVKETIGALIEGGLRALAPAFRAVVEFAEGLTNSLLSGEQATGRFSTAINIVVGVLRGVVTAFQTVYQVGLLVYDNVLVPLGAVLADTVAPALTNVAGRMGDMIERAKQIPIIGGLFRALGTVVSTFRDLLDSVPATFAGFRAAAQQAVTNVIEYFEGLVRSAKIVAKEIDLTLSIRSGTRERLQAEIAELKQQEIAAKAAGRSVASAYADARNAALAEAATATEEAARANERRATAAATEEAVEGENAKQLTLAEIRKKALEKRLAEIEAAAVREEIVTDRAYFKKEISEGEHARRMLLIRQRQYSDQLKALELYKDQESKAYLDAQRKLQEVQTTLARPTAAPLQTLGPRQIGPVQSQTAQINKDALVLAADDEIKILQDKISKAIDLEHNSELLRLELLRNALSAKLQLMQDAGLAETSAYKNTLDEKAKADELYQKTLLENEKRTAALKDQIQAASLGATADFFGIFADLLAKDEAARKKNAEAIKAFQSAQVVVQGIAEVQKIWAGAAELGPIAGPIIGAIQTAVAVARSAVAISKIQNAKFAGGGFTGFGWGSPDETGHRPVGIVHEKEWVGPAWMVQSPQYAPMFHLMEAIRRRGFADGGYSTTPAPSLQGLPVAGINQQELLSAFAMMADEIRGMRSDIGRWRERLRADVVYTDVEDAGAELATVRDDAGI